MNNREQRAAARAESTAFAPLNPAHLTHEPVRRHLPWSRIVGCLVAVAVVVEAVRLVFGA